MKWRLLLASLLCLVPCIVAAQTPNTFAATGSMSEARVEHTATLLPNSKVLIAGGATSTNVLPGVELYDPSTGMFVSAGNLVTARSRHTATLLPNGKVLIVGGDGATLGMTATELYDPSTGTFSATASMTTGRSYHTATLLQTGKVLIAGGYGPSGINASAELYDPTTGTFTVTGSMQRPRYAHTATLLPNGMVLITGGASFIATSGVTEASAEIYNPTTETFTLLANSMTTSRAYHTATSLLNGKVLLAGGDANVSFPGNALSTANLFDPATNTFTPTGPMTTPRFLHTATLLSNGQVLVAGGDGTTILVNDSAELYDADANSFSLTANMSVARDRPTATLLTNGSVLVAGGANGVTFLATAELYTPNTPVLIWPVSPDNRGDLGQTYAQFNLVRSDYYHTGLDIAGSEGITAVLAAGDGSVRRLDMDPERFRGDNHCMGNVVIIDHSFGTDPAGPFTLYAHLKDIVVADGSRVAQGTQIGTVGRTPLVPRDGCIPPSAAHLHFEVKDRNVLGDIDDEGPNWGYTPNHPDQHGYHDPLVSVHSVSDLDPVVRIRISENGVNIRVGPGGTSNTSYRIVNELSAGEEYDAFRSAKAGVLGCSRGWYQIRRIDGGRFVDLYGGEVPAGWICANFVTPIL